MKKEDPRLKRLPKYWFVNLIQKGGSIDREHRSIITSFIDLVYSTRCSRANRFYGFFVRNTYPEFKEGYSTFDRRYIKEGGHYHAKEFSVNDILKIINNEPIEPNLNDGAVFI